MSKHLIFADESGTDVGHQCYTIGALKLSNQQLELLINKYDELNNKYRIIGEIKWKKIGDSAGIEKFGLEMLDFIIKNNFEISFIVVRKNVFRKWSQNKETAFYMTYNYLLKHILKVEKGDCRVFIDNRNDSYKKQDEVIGIITNNMLNQANSDSNIEKVTKSDSKTYKAIQIIDLFIGAINASTNIFLNNKFSINEGKKEFITKMADYFGWDALYYDTFPNNFINIWHFPIEFRAIPKSQNITLKKK
jgi:hypothetical protein